MILRRLFTFGVMGVLGTPAHYLTLIVLVEAGGAGPVLATSLGSLVGALVNYTLNYHYTFRSSKAHLDAVPKFLLIALLTGILNAGLVYAGVDLVGLHYLLVQVGSTVTVFLCNFGLHSVWTFREDEVT